VNWSGQLYPDLAFAKSETGSTRSCTKRGFSCPVSIKDRDGIAHATIVITDDAVVSYTTFSPFLGFFSSKKSGCMFSVILSVPAGCCLRNPRFLRLKRTREAPCLVVFGLSSPLCLTERSDCLTHQLLLLDLTSSLLNNTLPKVERTFQTGSSRVQTFFCINAAICQLICFTIFFSWYMFNCKLEWRCRQNFLDV
jgi:hypothetical protein